MIVEHPHVHAQDLQSQHQSITLTAIDVLGDALRLKQTSSPVL